MDLKEITDMKKFLSLLLVLLCILPITSCKKETNKSVYFNYFGKLYDVTDPDVVSDYGDIIFPPPLYVNSYENFTDLIEKLGEDNFPEGFSHFAVVRARCTGDMRARVKDKEHYMTHSLLALEQTDDKQWEEAGWKKNYVEIPFEIVDVLEGDSSFLTIGEEVFIETDFFLQNYFITWASGDWEDYDYDNPNNEDDRHKYTLFGPAGEDSILPRVGYEYVFVVFYVEKTDCIYAKYRFFNYDFGCELSSPEDFCSFRERYLGEYEYKPGDRKYATPEQRMPKAYWEILERYNIEIE